MTAHQLPADIRRKLDDAHRDLTRIRLAIGPVYGLLSVTAPDGYSAGGDGGPVSGVSDPTLGAVVAREGDEGRPGGAVRWDLIRRQVVLIHTACDALAGELGRLERMSPDEAKKLYDAARCVDPVCGDMAVRSGWCWRHYRDELARRRAS